MAGKMGCMRGAEGPPEYASVAESNKALVARLVRDVFNGERPASIDEIFAPSFMNHNALPGTTPGPEGTRRANEQVRAAFPDWTESIEQLIAEDDRVVLYAIGRGTQDGEFMGISPTGASVEVAGIAIFRVADGRIVEQWGLVDMLGMLRQLKAPV
jgi:predicted ester cyclase